MSIEQLTARLRTERMRVWEEGKALLDTVSGREMSAEERQNWARINDRIDEIDDQVRKMSSREQREQEHAVTLEALGRQFGEAGSFAHRQREAEQLRNFLTPGAAGAAFLDVNIARVVKEKELIRQGATADEVRALAWDTGSVASAVPTLTERRLYEYLESTSAMMRMPTTKLVTESGAAIDVPRLGAHAIATQVSGQGTTLAGTDPTFLSTTLNAYKYGELVIVASEVVQDTVIDIVDFLSRDIGRALGRVIETDLVTGSGTGKPNGVMTSITGSGTIATGGSLIDPTYEKLVDLVYSVNDEYRASGNAAWLMRDLTAGVIRKIRDGAGGTTGAPMWEPSLTAGIQGGQPDKLLGFPVYTSFAVASLASDAKVVAFGDFSAYYVRSAGPIRLERDDSRYFDTDQVAVRGKARIDGDSLDSSAINIIKRSV